MALELSTNLRKSPSQVNENHFGSVASTGVILSSYSKNKDSTNYFNLNTFMEQSPANLDSPLASGVIHTHRHTPNHLILADNSKNAYFSANNNQTSPTFQSNQRASVHNNNFLNSQSPARSDFDISSQRQQQDTLFFSHSTMFDPASTTTNSYNHSFGIFGGNPVNLHGTTNLSLMNSSVDIKPTIQSLPTHPFYSHSTITPSHDQGTVQRAGMSPILANPMGYRSYPQINELLPARADYYTQQAPFGHPQYW